MCFDIERFEDQETACEFLCSICKNVLCCPQKGETSPQSKQEIAVNADGHNYCEECIMTALEYNKACPECRKDLDVESLQPLNRTLTNLLKSLKLKCKYYTDGCNYVNTLETIESHESFCEFGAWYCESCDSFLSKKQEHFEIDCIKMKFKKTIQEKNNEIKHLKEENSDLLNKLEEKTSAINKLTNELNWIKGQIKTNSTLNSRILRHQVREIIDLCSKTNHFNEVRQMIQQNANVNYKDQNGYTALMKASANGHLNIVKLLLDNGASASDKNKNGWTALMLTCSNGHINVAKLLVEKGGAYINDKDNTGCTALMAASHYGRLDIAKYLLSKGEVNMINEKEKGGWTALSLASHDGHLDLVKVLIANGANVNLKNVNGYSALTWASKKCHLGVVKVLIKKGAIINDTTISGHTPLSLTKNSDIKRYLRSKGAI